MQFWRVILNGEHAKIMFALQASEVIFDSEVHFVSEVSPGGEVKSCIAAWTGFNKAFVSATV